jgi:hypothetical protein
MLAAHVRRPGVGKTVSCSLFKHLPDRKAYVTFLSGKYYPHKH